MQLARNPGRTAGFLSLITTVLGMFSFVYARNSLIVPGNPTATAANILASETLYRASIASGLISGVSFFFLVRALYRLLNHVNKGQASLMVALVMIIVAIGCALTVNDLAVLVVLRGTDSLAGFSQLQREALASLFLDLSAQGNVLAEIFWGLWLFPFGLLVIRSGFIPRIFGILLIISGVAYIVAFFTGLLLPAYESLVSKVIFVPALGEVWIMLWLLIKGATVPAQGAEARRA